MAINTGALYSVATEPVTGKFYRYVLSRYADEPLSMFGAMKNGGRYNVAELFGALYLGFDRQTCEAEVNQGIAAGLPFKKGAFTAWDYDVNLKTVDRLDQGHVQKEIEVTAAEISKQGDHWTASGIGEHLHKRGDVEGLTAPSAQLPGGLCLDVFLDRVKDPSYVKPLSKLGAWP